MELETLSKEELLVEFKLLEAENSSLKQEHKRIWDNVKTLIMKVSHEIKTPLNSIIGYSELFKDFNKDLKLKHYINNIQISSRHMLSLIQSLIDITKYQNKQLVLEYSIFNAKDAIDEVISGFNRKNINYTIIDFIIMADYTRFKQVVYNLISNSIKYSNDDKNIDILTYEEDGYFCFEITDKGEGIKRDDYEKIFELYSQVSYNDKKCSSGLGIGLALCRAIINAHGGEISVESVLNEGTTFNFKIPVSPSII